MTYEKIWKYRVMWRDKNGIQWGHSFTRKSDAEDYYNEVIVDDRRIGVTLKDDEDE